MNKPAGPVLLIILFIAGINGLAQVQDAGLWMSVNIEKKITPAFSACFTEEMRMNENITEAGTVLSDIGMMMKFGKHFRAGVGYRYIRQRRVDDSYDNRHRYYIDLAYRQKIKKVILNLRARYHSQYTDINTSPEGTIPKNMIVPKLEIKYNLPGKFEPYIYGEAYFLTNNLLYGPIVQMRVCGGVEYSFNRMHALDVYYLIRKEYNVKHPQTDYVTGLGYKLTF